MASINDMSAKVKIGVIVGLAALLTAGLYVAFFKTIDDQNRTNRLALQAKKTDNDVLRPFEKNLPELNRQIETLKQQLEIQKRIVPDEKEAPSFMKLMQETAGSSGIEIRRYTSKPGSTREFYTEVPFDIELDGPYFSMLNFFDRVAKLERIINISSLQLASIKGGESKVKHNYKYAPQETVLATCTSTTFFSHDAAPEEVTKAAGKAKGSKSGTAAAAKKK